MEQSQPAFTMHIITVQEEQLIEPDRMLFWTGTDL